MIRGTALGLALAKAVEKAPQGGLGIEHCIRHRVNETHLGIRQEPDVHLHTRQYTGPYNPSKKAKTTVEAQVESQHQEVQPNQR